MQIFVKTLGGSTLTVPNVEDVAGVKRFLAETETSPSEDLKLVFGDKLLEDNQTLAECGLSNESTIFVTAGLDGGAKKRKKKTYTKPKKLKHKRKKVKLAVLKLYKVDNSGKVQRLRKESPMHPGCFMAMHFNRYYCGKTGLTYVLKKGEGEED